MPDNISQSPSKQSPFCKVFQLIALVILIYMVFVQFNDPDSIFWILVYGACALIPAFSLFNINSKVLFIACLALCFIALFLTFEGALEYLDHYKDESLVQSMSADKPYIEETREFLGTLICLLLISINQLIITTRS